MTDLAALNSLADMVEVARRYNAADDATLVLAQDYLEVVATKR